MKFFNYLKITVFLIVFALTFSCSDNENLDEIIEPETRLMSRGIGIFDQDNENENENESFNNLNCIEFCFKPGLSRLQKRLAVKCLLETTNNTSLKQFIPQFYRFGVKSPLLNSSCEIWGWVGKDPGPSDDGENEGQGNDNDDEDIIELIKKSKTSCNYYDLILSYNLNIDCDYEEKDETPIELDNAFFQK